MGSEHDPAANIAIATSDVVSGSESSSSSDDSGSSDDSTSSGDGTDSGSSSSESVYIVKKAVIGSYGAKNKKIRLNPGWKLTLREETTDGHLMVDCEQAEIESIL